MVLLEGAMFQHEGVGLAARGHGGDVGGGLGDGLQDDEAGVTEEQFDDVVGDEEGGLVGDEGCQQEGGQQENAGDVGRSRGGHVGDVE